MISRLFHNPVIITVIVLLLAPVTACSRHKSSDIKNVISYANQNKNDNSMSSLDLNEPKCGASTEPVIEGASGQWDETLATNLVLDELKKYTGWRFQDEIDYSKDLHHQLDKFQKIGLDNKNFMIGIVYSKLDESYLTTDGYISIFEFENKGGWLLTNKAIAFSSFNIRCKVYWYRVAPNNYTISVSNSYYRMGETNAFTNLYTFLNGKISNVLTIEHNAGEEEEYYNIQFKLSDIVDNNGYYYLLAEEKSKYEEKDTLVNRNIYAFNGAVYEEFNGSITDPSLTSMDRFIDINSIKERGNNVCPTCHGTGIVICPLCAGTGVNNMGIECGCIRTHNMEKAAGHEPSHPPLRWTCPACVGTGKPS